MKTLKVLLLSWILLPVLSYGQEQIFSKSNDGNIVVKPQYIESFHNGDYKNITPYIVEQSKNETALDGSTYLIKCLKYRNWENDPGDMHVLEVLYQDKVIYSLVNNNSGWENIADEPQGVEKTPFYYKMDLDDNTIALLFVGVYIMSQPPYLTVVILKNGNVALVFNKPSYINKIERNGGEINFTLQSNTLEYLDMNSSEPINPPDLHTLTLKNGMIYYK